MLLGLCGFWAGLAMACRLFPGEYDWRYMTVSNLFSAKHNPTGHLWGAAGVILCGVMGMCWVVLGMRTAPTTAWRLSFQQSPLLVVGFPCMTLAAAPGCNPFCSASPRPPLIADVVPLCWPAPCCGQSWALR